MHQSSAAGEEKETGCKLCGSLDAAKFRDHIDRIDEVLKIIAFERQKISVSITSLMIRKKIRNDSIMQKALDPMALEIQKKLSLIAMTLEKGDVSDKERYVMVKEMEWLHEALNNCKMK
jgi:phosphorylcholine metabolism protein LicD